MDSMWNRENEDDGGNGAIGTGGRRHSLVFIFTNNFINFLIKFMENQWNFVHEKALVDLENGIIIYSGKLEHI